MAAIFRIIMIFNEDILHSANVIFREVLIIKNYKIYNKMRIGL